MKGMLVGGVNSAKEDSAAKAYLAGMPSAKCYVDHSESYSTNEVTTYWNSPLIYLLALAQTEEIPEPAKGDVNLDAGSVAAGRLDRRQCGQWHRSGIAPRQSGDLLTDTINHTSKQYKQH